MPAVFPNPSTGKFQVILNGMSKEHGVLDVVDLPGKKIYSTVLHDQKIPVVDLSTADNGIYFLIVHDENGTHVIKLIKQ
jgi:hypothetical protein